MRRTGVGREGEKGGGRRRRWLRAQQAQWHRGFAVVLLLAAISDLFKAGGVVPTAGETNQTIVYIS